MLGNRRKTVSMSTYLLEIGRGLLYGGDHVQMPTVKLLSL
jgi:hypothetical protein